MGKQTVEVLCEGLKLLQDPLGGMTIMLCDDKTRNSLSVEKMSVIRKVTSEFSRIHPPHLLFRSNVPGVFATGANMTDLHGLSPNRAHAYALEGQRTMTLLAQAVYPVGVLVEGACRGGALDLVLACPFRFMTDQASYGHPGAAIGMITGWSGTSRFPAQVGFVQAREALTRGRIICSAEAAILGLGGVVKGPLPAPFSSVVA